MASDSGDHEAVRRLIEEGAEITTKKSNVNTVKNQIYYIRAALLNKILSDEAFLLI